MTSQPVKQTIVIHILTNNSRSHGDIIALYPCKNKGNQTMKFGQLIEYSVHFSWNVYTNDYTKCGGETIPRPI